MRITHVLHRINVTEMNKEILATPLRLWNNDIIHGEEHRNNNESGYKNNNNTNNIYIYIYIYINTHTHTHTYIYIYIYIC